MQCHAVPVTLVALFGTVDTARHRVIHCIDKGVKDKDLLDVCVVHKSYRSYVCSFVQIRFYGVKSCSNLGLLSPGSNFFSRGRLVHLYFVGIFFQPN